MTAFASTAPTRPVGRTAWIVIGSIVAVAALVYGAFSVASLLAYDAYDRHASFSGAIQVVEVDADAGGIQITGRDTVGASVDTHVIRGFTRPSTDVALDRGRLIIHNHCNFTASWCSVMTRVEVYRTVKVVIRTSGGGARVTGMVGGVDVDASGGGVHVAGTTGELRLRSSGGGIDGVDIDGGVVDASASGGGVDLQFRRTPLIVDASSSGGGVTVVVPRTSTSYKVDASSSGGSTRTDVRTDPESPYAITARSSGGGVTVRYPDR